jgi:hypothetical protein
LRLSVVLRNLLYLSAGLNSGAGVLFAQSTREAATREYVDFYSASRPIYQAAPVSHVVPEFNTVTYSVDARKLETTVIPDSQTTGGSSTIAVTGYRVSPYLALSLKRFGLGFNLDAGQTEIEQTQKFSTGSIDQKSQAVYRGLGIYTFFKLIDTKIYDLTVIGGGRSVNVRHVISPYKNSLQSGGPQTSDEAYHYTVNVYEAGVSNDFHLLKSVIVNPWVNYQKVDASNALAQTPVTDFNRDVMDQDVRIMWKSRRVIDYGIDLAVRLGRFELKLGGLMGLVFTSNGTSDTVTDKGSSIAISFDHKG